MAVSTVRRPDRQTLTAASATMVAPTEPVRRTAGPATSQGIGNDPTSSKALWRYYDEIPEASWFVAYVASHFRLCRLVAARKRPGAPEPRALDVYDDEGEVRDDADEIEVAVAETVGSFRSATGDLGSLLEPLAENLAVIGSAKLLGMPARTGDTAADMTDTDTIAWWEVCSDDELRVRVHNGRRVVERSDRVNAAWSPVPDPDKVAVIALWTRHPRHTRMVKSPMRVAATTLARLERLDAVIDAAADSRLLGRGVFLVPQEIDIEIPKWLQQFAPPGGTVFDALFAAMSQAIEQRDSAIATSPITVQVPAELVEHFRHIEFPLSIDEFFATLRAEVIQRLAVAWQLPTERMQAGGVSGMNHWGAWEIGESEVRTTWRPLAETVCDALTVSVLWPALRDAGIAEWWQYVVWYDLSDLLQRPVRATDAAAFHDRGLLSDTAAATEAGFSPSQIPDPVQRIREAAWRMLAAPETTPTGLAILSAMPDSGLDDIDLGALLPAPAGEAPAPVTPSTGGGVPDTANDPPPFA